MTEQNQLARAPVGVLLVNTGTPDSPAVGDVRRYLAEFLGDPRVVDLPPLARWLLLHLVILPFRPRQSAHAYQQIWTPQGSPLRVHGEALAQGLQAELGGHVRVRLAFQYGNPSIPQVVDSLVQQGVDRLVAVPLFPQYAAASFGAAAEAVLKAVGSRWNVPAVTVVPPFWHEAEFLDEVTASLRQAIEREQPDHVLLSFHGVPERHLRKSDPTGQHCLQSPTCCEALGPANRDCYRAQCFATAREVMARLALDPATTTVSFQSRLGRTPWIRPYTDEVLEALAQRGVKKVVVAAPSFVADCLETLEEIGMRGREVQVARGGELVLVPALNASDGWVRGLAAILRRQSAWL